MPTNPPNVKRENMSELSRGIWPGLVKEQKPDPNEVNPRGYKSGLLDQLLRENDRTTKGSK